MEPQREVRREVEVPIYLTLAEMENLVIANNIPPDAMIVLFCERAEWQWFTPETKDEEHERKLAEANNELRRERAGR